MFLKRLGLATLLLLPLPALGATGDWSVGDHLRLRLLAVRGEANGTLDGAIEIELDPGWKTYWRSPGDSGIPPRFDFSASTNASAPAIEFPPPERSDDGFSVSNVYHDRVVLPVRFAVGDMGADVELAVKADLGVCAEICLPVALDAAVSVPAGETDSAAAGQIAEARAALPGPGRPGEFEILSVKRVGGEDKAPEFEAEVAVGDADGAMLFAETPSDWYAAPPALAKSDEGRAVYRFAVDRKTATTPIAGAELRLTLVEGDASTSRVFALDAAPASP